MTTLYKLTDSKGQTYMGTQWGPGVTHTASGIGSLCSSGWIHAYEHPLLAVLLNPIHANFTDPQLWEAEGEIGIRDGQLKCGVKSLTTLKRIDLPQVTTRQRVRFAILCAKSVNKGESFNRWANNWLSNKDRSWDAARAAAWDAARAAAWDAAKAAARAAAEDAALNLITLAEEAIAI